MARTGATKQNLQLSAAQTALNTVEDRQEKYGPPHENFQTIADLWTIYIQRKKNINCVFDRRDVPMMMTLLKIAREAHMPQRDNVVDTIGYMECYDRV